MIFLYIALSIAIVVSSYRLFLHKELSFDFFLFWSLAGIFLFIMALFPRFLDLVRRFFDPGNQSANFVFIISILALLMLVMKISILVREAHLGQERSTQRQALINFRLENAGRVVRKNDVLVKLAAFNESENIREVLGEMPEGVDVLVIDDGSTDNTGEVAQEYGAMVIRHSINLGQGSADISGFMYALDEGYEIVIEMDADGQHDPQDITHFVEAMRESDADVITGSRVLGSTDKNYSQLRSFFLPYYTKLLNSLTGYNLTDSMCGFKAFRMSTVRKDREIFDEVIESQYLASELYIRLSHREYKITEIPIHIGARGAGMSRKGTFRYGLRVLRIMLRVWLMEKLISKRKRMETP
jgi:hypothetical protein